MIKNIIQEQYEFTTQEGNRQVSKSLSGRILGLSDNGELYELCNNQWSHVCSSPDDKEKPYFENGVWKKKNG